MEQNIVIHWLFFANVIIMKELQNFKWIMPHFLMLSTSGTWPHIHATCRNAEATYQCGTMWLRKKELVNSGSSAFLAVVLRAHMKHWNNSMSLHSTNHIKIYWQNHKNTIGNVCAHKDNSKRETDIGPRLEHLTLRLNNTDGVRDISHIVSNMLRRLWNYQHF